MWPDRVSNPGPLTYDSGALPTALLSQASKKGTRLFQKRAGNLQILRIILLFRIWLKDALSRTCELSGFFKKKYVRNHIFVMETALQKIKIQSNFNGSNTYGTTKISSR